MKMMMKKFFSIINLALKSCCKKTKAANHSFPFIKIENKKRHPYLRVYSWSRLSIWILNKRRAEHTRNFHRSMFFMKSLPLLCFICALNPKLAIKIARGCKNRKKLLQTPKVAQKSPGTIGEGLVANCFLNQLSW